MSHILFSVQTKWRKNKICMTLYSKAIVKAYDAWFVRTLSLSVSGNNRLCSALRAITWTIYRFSSRSPTSFDFLMSVPGFSSYSVGKFPLFSIILQWIMLIMPGSNIYRIVRKLRIIALNYRSNTRRSFFRWTIFLFPSHLSLQERSFNQPKSNAKAVSRPLQADFAGPWWFLVRHGVSP